MKDVSLYETISRKPKDTSVSFFKNRHVLRISPHWHEHTEILFFTKGGCSFFCDGHTFEVREGDIVVINSTQVHSYTATDGVAEHYCMHLTPTFFSDVDFQNVQIQNLIRDDAYATQLIKKIRNRKYIKKKGNDLMMKSHAYALLAHFLKKYSYKEDTEETKKNTDNLKRMEDVFSYIDAHYNEDISTSELASLMFVSVSYFCRFFKKVTGTTSAAYISELRIKKSLTLIENTDLGMAEIAERVGFDDPNYFSRVFRSVTGITPSEYRKGIGEEQQ
ncbi:MAG: helix-turn-helix domain-containing protein [Ruminococcaceae bacterium]|nr:helix-turn-helix domain-containing protein [Oscillospiraceae bacterium]